MACPENPEYQENLGDAAENGKENVPDPGGPTGPDDWSPLAQLTGTRPNVSNFGVRRFSNMEWRRLNQKMFDSMPNSEQLEHDTKAVIAKLASDADREQNDNRIRLQQRAAEVRKVHLECYDLYLKMQKEYETLETEKTRLRNAITALSVVEEINEECRKARKARMEDDLVRDIVEDELLQEKGLTIEVRDLYTRTLGEVEAQIASNKAALNEIQVVWGDGRETLKLEGECVGFRNSTPTIMFGGNANYPKDQSSIDTWNRGLNDIMTKTKNTMEKSKDLRTMLDSSIVKDSVRDLRKQSDKVLNAFGRRIEETDKCRWFLEKQLQKSLEEIAKSEDVNSELLKLGRRLDFTLKVVQSRLETRKQRPGLENCRDVPHAALIKEMKNQNERTSALQYQLGQLGGTLDALYQYRADLEKQIRIKRNTLFLDQRRCMTYRNRYPSFAALLGRA